MFSKDEQDHIDYRFKILTDKIQSMCEHEYPKEYRPIYGNFPNRAEIQCSKCGKIDNVLLDDYYIMYEQQEKKYKKKQIDDAKVREEYFSRKDNLNENINEDN